MSSALISQVVAAVATVVAVSGTAILLAISMQKSVVVSTSSFFDLITSSPSNTSKSKQLHPRSCFSNPDGKKKKKKKVRFAEDVKDSIGNSEEYRRANHKRLLSLVKTATEADHAAKNCRALSFSGGSSTGRGAATAPENCLCN